MFNVFAKGIGVLTAKNLFYVVNGDVFDFNTNRHITFSEMLKSRNVELFCKPVDGECGKGIFKMSISDGTAMIDNKIVDENELSSIFSHGRYIAQEIIKQHEAMSQLHSASINSLRLITVRSLKDKNIHVLPSILRIGVGKNVVDNTSQGGIAVGFDVETGRLKEYGFYKPEFGLKTDRHPDSGIVFKEFCIPHIEEAIRDAVYFHSMLPGLHSIGWDIAIGEDRPIFIEGNDNWEINGPQICNGGLNTEFKELFYV